MNTRATALIGAWRPRRQRTADALDIAMRGRENGDSCYRCRLEHAPEAYQVNGSRLAKRSRMT